MLFVTLFWTNLNSFFFSVCVCLSGQTVRKPLQIHSNSRVEIFKWVCTSLQKRVTHPSLSHSLNLKNGSERLNGREGERECFVLSDFQEEEEEDTSRSLRIRNLGFLCGMLVCMYLGKSLFRHLDETNFFLKKKSFFFSEFLRVWTLQHTHTHRGLCGVCKVVCVF